MSDFDNEPFDETWERYLDGALPEAQRREIDDRVARDPRLASKLAQHRQLEIRLRANFDPDAPSVQEIEQWLSDDAPVPPSVPEVPSRGARRVWTVGILAVTAALAAWIWISPQFRPKQKVTPFFEQRPLAKIYKEIVDQGFRPYYFCEDQERFARTFRKRQATSLQLAQLPEDRRMVGLSYPGGLSRNTTAMLAYVKDQPVVVFVDQLTLDNQALLTKLSPVDQVLVHRSVLGDLVVYEVTPLSNAEMSPFLRIQPASQD